MAALNYDITSDVGKVRLLLNDVTDPYVFEDAELQAFLDLEGAVKLAAAQAIDTNADDQVLASKVLRTQDLTTDGAKVAEALHKRAAMLRDQHDKQTAAADDGTGSIFVVNMQPSCEVPELAERPHGWY